MQPEFQCFQSRLAEQSQALTRLQRRMSMFYSLFLSGILGVCSPASSVFASSEQRLLGIGPHCLPNTKPCTPQLLLSTTQHQRRHPINKRSSALASESIFLSILRHTSGQAEACTGSGRARCSWQGSSRITQPRGPQPIAASRKGCDLADRAGNDYASQQAIKLQILKWAMVGILSISQQQSVWLAATSGLA